MLVDGLTEPLWDTLLNQISRAGVSLVFRKLIKGKYGQSRPNKILLGTKPYRLYVQAKIKCLLPFYFLLLGITGRTPCIGFLDKELQPRT
jgi:hypothetical protein